MLAESKNAFYAKILGFEKMIAPEIMIKQRIDWQSRRKNRIAIYCKKAGDGGKPYGRKNS